MLDSVFPQELCHKQTHTHTHTLPFGVADRFRIYPCLEGKRLSSLRNALIFLFPPCLVDRSAVNKSIINRGSFKDQMSVSTFSVNDERKVPQLHLPAKYSDMMKKIHTLEESNYFQRLWKQKAE